MITPRSVGYPLAKLRWNTNTGYRSFSFCLVNYNNNKAADADDLLKRIKITPLKREGESKDKKIARLVYQSRKRGILETDILLSGFASKYLRKFNDAELEEYDQLLNELDWDIYYWATKNYKITQLPKRWENSKILELLQDYSANKEKKILRVPEVNEY